MWVEVTVLYAELVLDNPPARAPWLQYMASINLPARFYYGQIVWVDQIRVDQSGQIWYRLNEKYGSGDIFWGQAEAFRPITAEELTHLSPEAQDKRIVVKVFQQTIACYEGTREVHFAKISSGALYDAWGNRVDAWETPVGESPIWRKAISLPLSGGSALAGWSLLVQAVILPDGHTPPDRLGRARPNEAEIPAHLRPVWQSFASLPTPVPAIGQAVRIQIPAIAVDAPVVQGDGWEQLKRGVAQHIGTPNPA